MNQKSFSVDFKNNVVNESKINLNSYQVERKISGRTLQTAKPAGSIKVISTSRIPRMSMADRKLGTYI